MACFVSLVTLECLDRDAAAVLARRDDTLPLAVRLRAARVQPGATVQAAPHPNYAMASVPRVDGDVVGTPLTAIARGRVQPAVIARAGA